jgi:peroxiredoxin Q/BCP
VKTTIAKLGLFLLVALSACAGGQRGGDGQTRSDLLPVGSDVPPLVRVDHRGKVISLRSETPTLVYFYPRDGTPGCTKEACAFRDAWQGYERAGLRVIGVSSDSEEDHRKFAEEHNLPFPLIADPEHVWSDAFGVGHFAGLDARRSFLIDTKGKIVKVYEDVDPGVHAGEVLSDAQALGLLGTPADAASATPGPVSPTSAPEAPAPAAP